MIHTQDSLAFLKEQPDLSVDINYSDPPYALGSEIIIRPDGRVDYKNARDFMNKWDMPTGDWWSEWFTEAFRTTKHGGYVIMFGMDRQLLLFKYYAHLAGFTEKQSMYWYFISNFPKATDLSKTINKNAGAEREVVGGHSATQIDITAPSTPLAQKYNGYKYSIAPLKQTNETIMIFQKPFKTKGQLHDTLAYENGDETISVGAVDIDGNRVGTEGGGNNGRNVDSDIYGKYGKTERSTIPTGRYPSQTLVDTEAAKHLGEPSKILHQIELNEHDLYIYQPKVSKKERNAGCEQMEEKTSANLPMRSADEASVGVANDGTKTTRTTTSFNVHPTLKPIALNEKILRLLKTPNDQKIIYPFAGSGSEIIGGIKAGFTNWEGSELSAEYVEIAKARIEHWSKEPEESQLALI